MSRINSWLTKQPKINIPQYVGNENLSKLDISAKYNHCEIYYICAAAEVGVGCVYTHRAVQKKGPPNLATLPW
jgi:hypothetical protein